MTSTDLIHIKDDRIIISPKQVEYDVTDIAEDLLIALKDWRVSKNGKEYHSSMRLPKKTRVHRG